MRLTDKDFVHLHNHTDMGSNTRGFKDSVIKVDQLIDTTAKLGNKGVAITDHCSISAHVTALQHVINQKKKKKIPEDYKVILGNEIYLVDENEMNKSLNNKESIKFYHFILLAKNKQGHEYICKLSSNAWERSFSYKGITRTPNFKTELQEIIRTQDIIATNACMGGELNTLVTKMFSLEDGIEKEKVKEEIDDFMWFCIDLFGQDNFYLELQPNLMEEQIQFNKFAVKLAKIYEIKTIIATDAHYLRLEDKDFHEAFLTSDDNGGSAREIGDFYDSTHLYKVKEIYEAMDYLPEEIITQSIKNTLEIWDKCEEINLEKQPIIPTIQLPQEELWFNIPQELKEIIINYPNINELYNSDNSQDRYFIHLVFKGLCETRKIYKGCINKEVEKYLDRIELECKELVGISKGLNQSVSAYLVTTEKMINDLIWENSESIVGCGRGSVTGFVTAYLLNIVQVDALKQSFDLPHWRFLSATRIDFPDVDTDLPSHKRDRVFYEVRKYFREIGGDVVRCGAFRTETSKSAINTVFRGCKINNDLSAYVSNLVPIERGNVWSIEDCYYGNSEKGRLPVSEFKRIIDEYEDIHLLDKLLKCQGLITGITSHPCGIVPFSYEMEKNGMSKMKAPNGETIICYGLHESEYCSAIKVDFLCTKQASLVQICMELLLEYGYIEWQGSLRKTYDKYFLPEILDQTSYEMWEDICNNRYLELFQFDTPMGKKALDFIKPHSLLELATSNSLMRLQVDSGEQPMEQYSRYKKDINEWYKDMEDYGLNQEEMDILKEHLLPSYGLCAEQETMMKLSMDKRISNFDVPASNKLRKSVAKKRKDILEETKQMFFEAGLKNGCREVFLDYIWNTRFSMQFGYSFSLNHTCAYSWNAIIEANLNFHYPKIFWNTAVLLIESNSVQQDIPEDYELYGKEKMSNTSEITKAISLLQNNNIEVVVNNINDMNGKYIPDINNNRIIISLKQISGLNNEIIRAIENNKPYNSLEDFYNRMVLTKVEKILSTGKIQKKSMVPESALISLIKAGAFDELEGKPREEIMDDFLHKINPDKKSLTNKDIDKIQELGLFPPEFDEYLKIYNYMEAVKECPKRQDEKVKSIKWAKLVDSDIEYQEKLIQFFEENFMSEMQEGRDYQYDENGDLEVALCSRKGSIQDLYKVKTKPMQDYLKSEECKKAYNNYRFNEFKKDKAEGEVSDWEFNSMGYYSKQYGHALAKVNLNDYIISNFGDLPEEPEIEDWFKIKGNKYPKFKISRICGTVIDKNISKHFITILTNDGKVVNCKMNKGQIAFYNKQISLGEGKDKVVLEKSYFERGTKLLLHGYRMGQDFKCKTYSNSIYGKHILKLIEEVYPDGTLKIKSERINIDDLD
ncbi:PHP domain-containing protein [Clostridium sp.]|uniref:PHP domain-containing protein n=1 Tax=Clostridium sp. TaxID=1506 RepID=UPI0025C6D40A|nr:PHP domain-containing protein [Clostridium sp.]